MIPSCAGLALCASLVALLFPVAADATTGPPGALDNRGWELVSPADKNGGGVGAPGTEAAAALQAAAAGGKLAFGSTASFAEATGAAPVSQYLGTRVATGWGTDNLTPPLLFGTYAAGPYQLFSADLSRAILGNGWSCLEGEEVCAAANPPLAPGAPPGYRNLYLREAGAYLPLLTTANAPALALSAEDFRLSLAGADPDLAHVVISTCAALTADANEVPDGGGGCEAVATNLYEWDDGALTLLNLLPGDSVGTPGATLAAPAGAVSADGSRVYFSAAGDLYLREGNQTEQIDESVGGGGAFQAASADGAVAFFTKAGHLYRYGAVSQEATDLTPGGGVQGVLGASADGAYLYYLAASGLYLFHEGASAKIAAAADAANYPPATGVARLSADGTRLAFVSSASLTGYPNAGKSELYLYNAMADLLLCASCNPKGTSPKGPSTIPGAVAVAEGPAAYKPRALSADGSRLFFDSGDTLLAVDTDKGPDVYEWEAPGSGGCANAQGCIGLISGGRVGSAAFADAGASGDDAFFTTLTSLLISDPGPEDLDVYDARVDGGFAEPPSPIACVGDACQGPAPAPEDPTPGTATFVGPANPPLVFTKVPCRKGKRSSRRGRARCTHPHRHGHRHRGRR